MATFKAGDKVKVSEAYRPTDRVILVGKEGVVTTKYDGIYRVDLLGMNYVGLFLAHELVPLTPPAEDTWAADKVRELVRPKPMDAEREGNRLIPLTEAVQRIQRAGVGKF